LLQGLVGRLHAGQFLGRGSGSTGLGLVPQRVVERLRSDLLRSREDALMCPLTGVLNRRGFDERLQAMLQQPPAPGQVHCLVLIDIDHFKRVNDELGHPVGDRVLQGLGTVLRSLPAEPGMACARYGGEEFAILLPHSQLPTAVRVAEAVRQRTHGIRLRHRGTQAVACTITVSAGVAAWKAGDEPGALLAGADEAMYRSKAQGRDRVSVV
jgi:diguanylate cyclase